MRLYFDTTQPNYIRRLSTIKQHDLLYVVCACPVTFEDNETRNFLQIFESLLTSVSAGAIVKEMAFKPFGENTLLSTPTKGSNASDGGSPKKRSRMSSPSPEKPKPKPIRMISPLDDAKENDKETSRSNTIDATSPPQTPTSSTLNHNQHLNVNASLVSS